MTEDNRADPSHRVAAKSCPVCGKPSVAAVEPFCSKRCADVDLHRWLGGVYAVPADPEGTDPDEDP